MENKKLLIAGIDPGTTTAYAVLDIEGNLLHLNSSKHFDLGRLILEVIEFGKVILVGTDKAKVPSLVGAFAAKLGARIVNPQEDLKVDEKRKMVQDFRFKDDHQGDALASALFAYKETKHLLDKIDAFAKENKKNDVRERIKELVIAKKISIKSAASVIEDKDDESKIIGKVIAERKLDENNFLRLFNKLKKYEYEIKLMKKYGNNLKHRIKNLEKAQMGKEKPQNAGKNLDFRENRIRLLESLLESKNREKEELLLLIKRYNNIISNIGNFYVLKKLDTLGMNEFNFKNKVLNIQRNDILVVDNPNIASGSVIDLLKNKVFVIIHKRPISKKIEERMPFVFMSAGNLKIEEDKYFGFVEKRHFEMEKGKVNWLGKVIEDYKKERGQLIE